MAKVLLKVFVDYETLGKTINILTAEGVTGFYCIEYWGLSPQNWSGFVIKEEPEMAIGAIRDNTEQAIQVNAVVNEDRAEPMTQALIDGLAGHRHTIMRDPCRRYSRSRRLKALSVQVSGRKTFLLP